ncbi:hypothetical protein PMI01_01849 [Caulobacter sp. AP07]|uniref:hypothetical protein n=1 Tax=Caulobacter sp. AP07 TaxID=1144304 RepID=UPI000271F269|nr:hypothetical protein [Caulobacter sp. AP07]EJL34067.1 hypothetical protein PMI01_01849 [Caulobacter sp. AP07]
MLHRDIVALALLCLAPAACGPRPNATTPPAETAYVTPADPVSAALSGAAQRSLEHRHPDAQIILTDQAMNQGVDQAWICGRYILLARNTRYDRFFIVSTTELVELRSKADRRWVETCIDAKPVPGTLDAAGAEAQAALLTRR